MACAGFATAAVSAQTISTFVGGGVCDGPVATNAVMNNPFGVATDGKGNRYITDADNHRIRKIDSSGAISTFAGNGLSGYFGDGSSAINAQILQPSGIAFDASGNLYFADSPYGSFAKSMQRGSSAPSQVTVSRAFLAMVGLP